MRARNDSVLAEVFVCIEDHYAEAISLKEVAVTVSLSPSYLTTVLRECTGRTVVECGSPSHGWPRRGGCWSRSSSRRGREGGSSQAKRGILPGSRLDSTTARCAP